MNQTIQRLATEPKRQSLTWNERWKSVDAGLISAWETGRELAQKNPDLLKRALAGELPVSAWKGGIGAETKKRKKFGTLLYLAELQGIRGENLCIDPSREYELTCARTGVTVTFTADAEKYCNV